MSKTGKTSVFLQKKRAFYHNIQLKINCVFKNIHFKPVFIKNFFNFEIVENSVENV